MQSVPERIVLLSLQFENFCVYWKAKHIFKICNMHSICLNLKVPILFEFCSQLFTVGKCGSVEEHDPWSCLYFKWWMMVKLRLGIALFANFIRRPVQNDIDQQTKLLMFENCGMNNMINEEKFYYLYKYIESSKRCAKINVL